MQRIGEALGGRTILITGATGFLAKALVEKLLRDIPTVRRIYLLIRSRGGSNGTRLSAEDRLWRDILATSAFNRLRREMGDDWESFARDRVVSVAGDLSAERLGLEESVYESLCRELDIVVNSAATVSFDERLDTAIETNVRGPSRLLDLARRCRELRGRPVHFLHVSTAYVSGWRKGEIPERPFSPGDSVRALRGEADAPALDLEAELKFCQESVERIEADSRGNSRAASFRRRAAARLPRGSNGTDLQDRGEALRQRAVKDKLVDLGMERARLYGWNDTYTFTKAMGEMLLLRDRGDLPLVILRPSIIESSMNEPEPGWLDGFRMADPLIMAYGKGVLKDFPARPEICIDLIPVDFVVNAIVAAMSRPGDSPHHLKVFHVASGSASPLLFDEFYQMTRDYFRRNPMTNRAGKPIHVAECTYPDHQKFVRKLRRRYLLPLRASSWLADRSPGVPRRLRARIVSLKSGVEQAIYYSELYGGYINYPYDFDVRSTLSLFDGLDLEDKKRFPFDVRGIDWRHYIQDVHIPGLKQNVLKLGTTNGRRLHRSPSPEETEHLEWAGDEQETLYDVLRFVADRHGDKTAIEMEHRGGVREEYTYRQLFEASRRAAEMFASRGVCRGDRIILWAESRPGWAVAYLGAACSGVTLVPVDPQTPFDELARVIQFTGATLVVASAGTYRRLAEDQGTLEIPVLNMDNDLQPFNGVTASPPSGAPCTWGEAQPEDTASIIFTSGTTVDPRAVLLTHRNIVSDAKAVGKVLRPYPTDRFLSVLPLNHVFEFTGGLLMPLWGGARITYVEAIKSRVILETMRRTGTTCMLGVPRLFEILHEGIQKQVASLSLPARFAFKASLGFSRLWRMVTGKSPGRFLFRRLHKHFGGSMRLFVSGGAALDPGICDSFALMGFPVCEGYGLTETSPVLTVNPLRRARPGSVGRPLPGVELRIDDPDDQGVGEIVVRGDMLMQGYLHNPEATRGMLRKGWLHTGDLGFQDPEGYLFITGRSKDLIVTASGKNVYPDEVEALYRKALPNVREMCVVGIRSNGGHGEEVHAVVVPERNGRSRDGEMETWRQEVSEAVKSASRRLPTYQRIQKVHYWEDDLPKTPTLKVQRRLVRDAIVAGRTGVEAEKPPAEAKPASSNGKLSPAEFERLLDVLSAVTKTPRTEMASASHLQFDLGMDSLMKVEMLAALEEAFAVRIPDSLAAELTTVQDVAERLGARRESERMSSRSGYWDRVLAGPAPENGTQPRRRRWGTGLVRRGISGMGNLIYRWYLPTEVHGIENVPETGACILVANHSSHLDSGAILVALGKKASGLRLVAAKDYFFSTRLGGWFFRNVLNALPFDRRERFIEGLRVCRAALERGERLLIFPEGTRSVTGELQPFKAGIGLLAVELGVPIIPARIQGTYEAMPKGHFWPRPGRIHVAFGEPMRISEPGGESRYEVYREVADEVRRRVEAIS